MKRILKILGILIVVLLLTAIVTPFLFKDKLEDLLKKSVNENINATISWESLDISLISSFPKASVAINDFMVINHTPFDGDTLAMGEALKIEMGIKQLLKKSTSDPIKVDALQLDEALIQLKINKEGKANYDIAKASESTSDAIAKEEAESGEPFAFDLDHYEINQSTIAYSDETTKTFFVMEELNHEGNGDFSAVQSTLDTETSAIVSLDMDNTNYVSKQTINLDAEIALDLESQKYTFKENIGVINDLILKFDGFVQLEEDATAMDISFKTPDTDFKNFLAVIPKAYAKNLDGVDTSGDFRISGKIKGKSTDTTIPHLDVAIVSNNASFKYPDLPKRMDEINIDTRILNTTGLVDDTHVMINKLNFKIDDDTFSAEGSLKNLTANMLVNLALKGKLDLANIEKVYPLGLKDPLSGILNANFTTNFDMNSVENHDYGKVNSSGSVSLAGFTYASEELPKPITINNARVNFTPGTIKLTKFDGKTGATDIKATGSIENLIPFVMSKEDLKGRFNISSDVFDLNDFSTTESVPETKNPESKTQESSDVSSIKIPDFLDAALDFNAKKVIYDDLTLENMKGTIAINEEQASLTNLTSNIFGGKAGLDGNVSTKNEVPVFNVKLDLSQIDIDQSFNQLPLLEGLAPIAKALQGALSTNINLTGQLDNSLSPILSSVAGNAIAKVKTTEVNTEEMPLLSALDNQLNFINIEDINLDELKASLQFKDGKVIVAPFDFDIKGIKANVSGGHSFENILDYALTLDVPAQYLGKDVSNLLSKLTKEEKESIHVPLPVNFSGNISKPNIKINTKAAIGDLTSQIIQIQKQHLKNKGNDIIKDVIDDVISDKVGSDTGSVIKDVLGNVLGGKKDTTTAKDSSSTTIPSINTKPKVDDIIKGAATDILGGLFGGKKKKEKNGN